MQRQLYEQEHEAFRESVAGWILDQVVPHYDEWERAGIVPREVWASAGKQGLLCLDVPTEYGGGGAEDWRFNAVLDEELFVVGAAGLAIPLHNDIVVPYLVAYGSEEQKRRWLPGMATGDLIGAIAMSEPGTGSDLAAIATSAERTGDHYVVNGAKTFISNGILADVVLVVVRTDPNERHRGLSILVVEREMPGFERGRNLDKIGMHAQDTAELSFSDVRVPVENLLGDEGRGFEYLVHNLAQERLVVAVTGISRARSVFRLTVEYCKERTAFGQAIGSFQANRFALAELATGLEVAQVFVDRCIEGLCAGQLTPAEAAMAKYWVSELEWSVVDRCLQLHGGYGYMDEYPVSRAFRDARVQRIYAGTNEVMREIIGRDLGF